MGANWCGGASERLRALGRAGSAAPPGNLRSAFPWTRRALRGDVRVVLEPGGMLHSRGPGSWGSPPTSPRLLERTCGPTVTPVTLCSQVTPVKWDDTRASRALFCRRTLVFLPFGAPDVRCERLVSTGVLCPPATCLLTLQTGGEATGVSLQDLFPRKPNLGVGMPSSSTCTCRQSAHEALY